MLNALSPFDVVFHGYAPRNEDRLPVAEIHSTEDSYLLTIEVPGYKVDELDITFDDDVLTVKGRRVSIRRERSFRRQFNFSGVEVDSDQIQACLEDGILSLSVPKTQKDPPKKISVRVHSVNPSEEE